MKCLKPLQTLRYLSTNTTAVQIPIHLPTHLPTHFPANLVSHVCLFCHVMCGCADNVRCEGSNFLEQAETCHYRDSSRCGPHAEMILDMVNITPSEAFGANSAICRCGNLNGNRECIRELPLLHPPNILMAVLMAN